MSLENGITIIVITSLSIGFVLGRMYEMADKAKKGRSNDW